MDVSSSFQTSFEVVPLIYINTEAKEFSKRLVYNSKILRFLFSDHRIHNKPVCIMSITGSRKSGKSLLMNYCIRYLKYHKIDNVILSNTDFDGFEWGPQENYKTIGAYIWNQPFLIETAAKNKIVVLIIDFNDQAGENYSFKESFVIKLLLKLFSSVELYNVSSQLTEADLANILLITEYGNYLKSKCESISFTQKHFQRLHFLIRDWPSPYEYYYGANGGKKYLNRLFSQHKVIPKINYTVRELLDNFYHDISCFLLPFPGSHVSNLNLFKGNWDEFQPDFQEYLLLLLESLFYPQYTQTKDVNGQTMTASQLISIFDNYYEFVISMPEYFPISFYRSTAKRNHLYVLNQAIQLYNKLMQNRRYLTDSTDSVLEFHRNCKEDALELLKNTSKYGTHSLTKNYISHLESQCDKDFIRFYAFNSTYPVSITQILSVNLISILFFFMLKIVKMILPYWSINILEKLVDTFTIITLIMLIIYTILKMRVFYKELKISEDIQKTLMHKFLGA